MSSQESSKDGELINIFGLVRLLTEANLTMEQISMIQKTPPAFTNKDNEQWWDKRSVVQAIAKAKKTL